MNNREEHDAFEAALVAVMDYYNRLLTAERDRVRLLTERIYRLERKASL